MTTELIKLRRAEFDALLEYSCTLPTGTTVGKRWKRRVPYQYGPGDKLEWFLGEYVEDPDPTKVGILWKRIQVVESADDIFAVP